jgi:glycosyltransferase involved in cell wall biosynthesis
MRLVATLLIRDEVDVAAAMIEHTFAQGAEFIVATDNGSVDGTRDVLEAYSRTGRLILIDEPGNDYRQGEWVSRMARVAAEQGADWVIHLDADEFVVPYDRSKTLYDVLASQGDEVTVVQSRRRNVRRAPGDDRHWSKALRWKDKVSYSERGTPLGPKIAHRADRDAIVAMGNHAVEGPTLGAPLVADLLEYLHAPDRSWQQYASKIRIGGEAVNNNKDFDPGIAWHWRQDYRRLMDGSLAEVYKRRQLTWGAVARGVVKRTLSYDVTLVRALERLKQSPVLEEQLRACLEAPGGRS